MSRPRRYLPSFLLEASYGLHVWTCSRTLGSDANNLMAREEEALLSTLRWEYIERDCPLNVYLPKVFTSS